jgi:hypothetical protein
VAIDNDYQKLQAGPLDGLWQPAPCQPSFTYAYIMPTPNQDEMKARLKLEEIRGLIDGMLLMSKPESAEAKLLSLVLGRLLEDRK